LKAVIAVIIDDMDYIHCRLCSLSPDLYRQRSAGVPYTIHIIIDASKQLARRLGRIK